jgi:hypothetical protein
MSIELNQTTSEVTQQDITNDGELYFTFSFWQELSKENE